MPLPKMVPNTMSNELMTAIFLGATRSTMHWMTTAIQTYWNCMATAWPTVSMLMAV